MFKRQKRLVEHVGKRDGLQDEIFRTRAGISLMSNPRIADGVNFSLNNGGYRESGYNRRSSRLPSVEQIWPNYERLAASNSSSSDEGWSTRTRRSSASRMEEMHRPRGYRRRGGPGDMRRPPPPPPPPPPHDDYYDDGYYEYDDRHSYHDRPPRDYYEHRRSRRPPPPPPRDYYDRPPRGGYYDDSYGPYDNYGYVPRPPVMRCDPIMLPHRTHYYPMGPCGPLVQLCPYVPLMVC